MNPNLFEIGPLLNAAVIAVLSAITVALPVVLHYLKETHKAVNSTASALAKEKVIMELKIEMLTHENGRLQGLLKERLEVKLKGEADAR